ncbi:MAG: 30S ribosomal protein S2 [Brevefilum sp.]|nr:30S ribosomal protein S2 [Brevefilum sp.]
MSPVVTMKALLESGVHFGHRTNKWNPKMRKYIFTERNEIHIIDLQQTVQLLDEAYAFVRDRVIQGGTVLFVGTKRQAQDTIREEADRCNMPYVNERWLGGTITNWYTIQQRIFELERLERMRDSGELDLLTKKEGLMINREIERLMHRLSGIRNMKRLPDILFVVDVMREDTAVHEANLKSIPVLAMVDTNCDPKNVDYVIPSNDDAIRAIKLIVGKMADAVMEGKAIRSKDIEDEEMLSEPMPAGVSRFIADDEELEDEALLGESTLKYLGSTKSPKPDELDEDDLAVEGLVEDDLVENDLVVDDLVENDLVVDDLVENDLVVDDLVVDDLVEDDVEDEAPVEEELAAADEDEPDVEAVEEEFVEEADEDSTEDVDQA